MPPGTQTTQETTMGPIVAAVIMGIIIGGLIYIYLDVRLHPGSYLKKSHKNKKNRKSK